MRNPFPVRFALYQPENSRNTGTVPRTAACLNTTVGVIEPCSFPFSRQSLKRGALDYMDKADLNHHADWTVFTQTIGPARLVLLTTSAAVSHIEFTYRADDILLPGQESAGVPEAIRTRADAHIRIPMAGGLRSLNVAVAGAIVLGEALRQTGAFQDLT